METEEAIQEILNDLENKENQRTFRSYLNNPELISLSSTNAERQSAPITAQTNNAFYNFTVNLPRPALDVKSIQLLKSIIPQAQCNIPDYSLVFPYYRLKCVPVDAIGRVQFLEAPRYSRDGPDNNLYYVRLLPSNYKPELYQLEIPNNNPSKYGWNKTFNDYNELLLELNKACEHDPIRPDTDMAEHFTPEDISFTFSEKYNKFVFEGNNSDTNYSSFPTWEIDTTYFVGNIVDYEGIVYRCIADISSGSSPNEDPVHWNNISQFWEDYPLFNIYIIAGYEDPNVQDLLKLIEADSSDDYFNGFTHITSIPGNKYVYGQTLARRLGFTWDGTYIIDDVDQINNLTNGIAYGGTVALFYNRMRPLPLYYTRVEEEDSTTFRQRIITTYMADGYCNLVYSSIISIYTTIIVTSSVDTQRNSNLLAMIDMNCGNLGVSMANNYIDTKLTKIQSEIYSIYIELRDENGQPYLLTNNAVVSLLLKLTYD